MRSFLLSHFVFTELKLSNSFKVIEINERQLLESIPIRMQSVVVPTTLNGFQENIGRAFNFQLLKERNQPTVRKHSSYKAEEDSSQVEQWQRNQEKTAVGRSILRIPQSSSVTT